MDHLLFSNQFLHSQVDLANYTSTNTRVTWLYHVCKSFDSTILLQPIYLHLIRNIKVIQVTPLIQVTPSYGSGNKGEILENAFSGIVATSQVHTKVITCGWRERIIKTLKKATPACNNRS